MIDIEKCRKCRKWHKCLHEICDGFEEVEIMSEDETTKKLKTKMNICILLQRKFGCLCVKNTTLPFCSCVEEIYEAVVK